MNRYLSSRLLLQGSGMLPRCLPTSASSRCILPGGTNIAPHLDGAASLSPSSPSYVSVTTRLKHSSTQVKRLFNRNPARRRIELRERQRQQQPWDGVATAVPQAKFSPILSEPVKILPNGWTPPPPPSDVVPNYPFRVARTRNKPNEAIGFLPVYSEFRRDGARVTTRIKKVTGNQDAFLSELRAALEIPLPNNPREDTVRIRTGGTIEVKGNRVREVKMWLAALGF